MRKHLILLSSLFLSLNAYASSCPIQSFDIQKDEDGRYKFHNMEASFTLSELPDSLTSSLSDIQRGEKRASLKIDGEKFGCMIDRNLDFMIDDMEFETVGHEPVIECLDCLSFEKLPIKGNINSYSELTDVISKLTGADMILAHKSAKSFVSSIKKFRDGAFVSNTINLLPIAIKSLSIFDKVTITENEFNDVLSLLGVQIGNSDGSLVQQILDQAESLDVFKVSEGAYRVRVNLHTDEISVTDSDLGDMGEFSFGSIKKITLVDGMTLDVYERDHPVFLQKLSEYNVSPEDYEKSFISLINGLEVKFRASFVTSHVEVGSILSTINPSDRVPFRAKLETRTIGINKTIDIDLDN